MAIHKDGSFRWFTLFRLFSFSFGVVQAGRCRDPGDR